MRSFHVYALIDPRNNLPFYVGKGNGKTNRLRAHLAEAKKPTEKQLNRLKCRTINEIVVAGYEVEYKELKTALSEVAAYKLEGKLIAKYGRKRNRSGILTNAARGGWGSDSRSGVEGFQVSQYTLDGKYVKTYSSCREACRKLGIHPSLMCSAINGPTTTAKGFRWARANEPLPPPRDKTRRQVSQYSATGKHIKTFYSCTIAARELGLRISCICACALGQQPYYAGFKWKYEN